MKAAQGQGRRIGLLVPSSNTTVEPEFYRALGVSGPAPHAALLLFMLVLPSFTFFLTPLAALAPDDVVVLRAYAKYAKQTGFTFSQAYIEQTLAAHPSITAKVVEYFKARFEPAFEGDREAAQKAIEGEIRAGLDMVSVAD